MKKKFKYQWLAEISSDELLCNPSRLSTINNKRPISTEAAKKKISNVVGQFKKYFCAKTFHCIALPQRY